MVRETTKQKVLAALARGDNTAEAARKAGCCVNYVCMTRWRAARPGYGAQWNRIRRASDPEYRQRERDAANRRYQERIRYLYGIEPRRYKKSRGKSAGA